MQAGGCEPKPLAGKHLMPQVKATAEHDGADQHDDFDEDDAANGSGDGANDDINGDDFDQGGCNNRTRDGRRR